MFAGKILKILKIWRALFTCYLRFEIQYKSQHSNSFHVAGFFLYPNTTFVFFVFFTGCSTRPLAQNGGKQNLKTSLCYVFNKRNDYLVFFNRPKENGHHNEPVGLSPSKRKCTSKLLLTIDSQNQIFCLNLWEMFFVTISLTELFAFFVLSWLLSRA